ncbi:MAG: NAD(P)-dependent glycerol-3-phosphate dehydrogenase [Candidatus Dadabacteria bacterium]|nr:NAD(P)-dependent glycerol-3-phosphate dehydrogenase [Candidatus Dadabacteria bacterium]
MSVDTDQKISVIGGGSWGTAIAKHLAEKGFKTTLWVKEPEVRDSIRQKRVNTLYLPEIELPGNLSPTDDINEAVEGREVLVFSVPSQFMREVLERCSGSVSPDAVLISTAKGIELVTHKLMHRVFADVFTGDVSQRYASLSGPSFALEVARSKPTAVSIASKNLKTAELGQRIFSNKSFRAYVTEDVVGVEVGGALKNVIAIAAGIVDGLELGHNSRSALITRGLAEITRLGMEMGANRFTFAGLAGMGDLVLTCTGGLSRNRKVGMSIARGVDLEGVLSKMRMVAEGVKTSRAALELSRSLGVEMPITEKVTEVLYEGKSPETAIFELMTRELKHEIE